MTIHHCNPENGNDLLIEGNEIIDSQTNQSIGEIRDGVYRFARPEENYADSFGWQWNHWANQRSTLRKSGFGLKRVVLGRTRFEDYDLDGKTLLECGCGGGDDTEVLLDFPLSEIHSFDLSHSVDRAKRSIADKRVVFSQASITQIPYPNQSFDVVYCHRVLQHTPDPVQSLESISQKVKPGGLLFAHAYKRSKYYMAEWRYKYLWFTKRLPHRVIYYYVKLMGKPLHYLNKFLYRHTITKYFAYRWIPFYHKVGQADVEDLSEDQLIDIERLITFDALTPAHDHPMTSEQFFGTIKRMGFEILHYHDPSSSPMYCTARKVN